MIGQYVHSLTPLRLGTSWCSVPGPLRGIGTWLAYGLVKNAHTTIKGARAMTLLDVWTEIVLACDSGLSIWEAQELAERYIVDTYIF